MHLYKNENKVFELMTNLLARIKLTFAIKGPPMKQDGPVMQPGEGPSTRSAHVTLQIYDPYSRHCVEVQGIKELEKLENELGKALFIGRCMEVDQQCSEELCHDLWGNSISIKEALESGLLKKRDHIKEEGGGGSGKDANKEDSAKGSEV